jgi:hypothetical protein
MWRDSDGPLITVAERAPAGSRCFRGININPATRPRPSVAPNCRAWPRTRLARVPTIAAGGGQRRRATAGSGTAAVPRRGGGSEGLNTSAVPCTPRRRATAETT